MSGSLDDDLPLEQQSVDDLVRLASGRDLWRKAPALSELADREPAKALPIAREAVMGDDPLVAAAGLRVLAAHEPDAARAFMATAAPTAPIRVLEAMIENLAVDAPLAVEEHHDLLESIARRLRTTDTDQEYRLASLFFRQYPELGSPS